MSNLFEEFLIVITTESIKVLQNIIEVLQNIILVLRIFTEIINCLEKDNFTLFSSILKTRLKIRLKTILKKRIDPILKDLLQKCNTISLNYPIGV